MKHSTFALPLVAVMVRLVAGAADITAAGNYLIESAVEMTLSEPLVVSDDAAVTNYPGYVPSGWFTAFRNVKVEDIDNISILFSSRQISNADYSDGNYNKYRMNNWWELVSWIVEDGSESGTRVFDVQHGLLNDSGKTNYICGASITLRQKGDDVEAKVESCKSNWAAAAEPFKSSFMHLAHVALAITNNQVFTDTSTVAWKNMTCQLNSGAASRPDRFVFKNTADSLFPNVVTSRHVSAFTDEDYVLFWKNTRLDLVTKMSAKLGGSALGSVWNEAQFSGNRKVQSDGSEIWMFQVKRGALYDFELRFKQVYNDVYAKIGFHRVVYGDYEVGFDFSTNGGATIAMTDKVDGDKIAISDIRCEWTAPDVRTDVYSGNDGWIVEPSQIAFTEIDLEDIAESTSIDIAGYSCQSSNNVPLVCNERIGADGSYDRQYQCNAGTHCNVSLRWEQLAEGILVTPHLVRRAWSLPYGADFEANVGVSQPGILCQTINGSDVSLHNLAVTRPWKTPLKITVGVLNPQDVPIELKNVSLTVAPAANQSAYLSSVVYGMGCVVKTGAGTAVLSADIRATQGLKVESGVMEIQGERRFAWDSWGYEAPLALGAEGTIRFVVGCEGVGKVIADSIDIEDGATIALRLDDGVELVDGELLTLTEGARLTADDLAKLQFRPDAALAGKYRMQLTLDSEGNLAVGVREKTGLMLIFR